MATAAVGDIVSNGTRRVARLMVAATANSGALSSESGIPVYRTPKQAMDDDNDTGLAFGNRDPSQCTLMIKGTCTTGQTLVGTFTLWGYLTDAAEWFEIPVNGGTAVTPVALAETDTDKIAFQQRFDSLGHYDRVALTLASIGGSGASFDAWLVNGRWGE